jgi:hypothetical protein
MATLYQQRLERERQARAKNVARLVASAGDLLNRANEERRDLLPHEAQQGHKLVDRAERIARLLEP